MPKNRASPDFWAFSYNTWTQRFFDGSEIEVLSQCFLLCPDCRNSVPKFFCYVLKLGISWGKNGSQIEVPVPMVFLICPEGNSFVPKFVCNVPKLGIFLTKNCKFGSQIEVGVPMVFC